MYSLCRHNRALMLLLSLFMALVGFPSGSSAQEKTLTVRSLAEAPAFAKRALVIGIGDYEHAASLAPTTYNDAKKVADLLQKQFGFPAESIVLMTDAPDTPDKLRPTYIHLKSAISTLLNGINEKSEVVIYFSGHGTRADNHDWLVPLDGLPAEVETTCINYDDFRSRLETKVPARALLIIDACRNLLGGKDAGSSGFGAGKGLTGPQFAELLSCRPKEISQVGKKEDFQESVFTHFLLEGLQGAPEAQSEGVVTFDSLKSFVQGSVSQYVSSKFGESQNPDGRASLGKMVLAKGSTGGVKQPKSNPERAIATNTGTANPRKKTLLIVTYTAAFRHNSVPTAERVLTDLGSRSGAYSVLYCRNGEDVREMLTPEWLNTNHVDGVFFANTTGNLGIPDMRGFLNWIKAGHAFLGAHAATDTYHPSETNGDTKQVRKSLVTTSGDSWYPLV
jgi:hypothetical protein